MTPRYLHISLQLIIRLWTQRVLHGAIVSHYSLFTHWITFICRLCEWSFEVCTFAHLHRMTGQYFSIFCVQHRSIYVCGILIVEWMVAFCILYWALISFYNIVFFLIASYFGYWMSTIAIRIILVIIRLVFFVMKILGSHHDSVATFPQFYVFLIAHHNRCNKVTQAEGAARYLHQ